MPAATPAPKESAAAGPHLILYDGECGFCHAFVRFVLARDVRGQFRFASLQSPTAAACLAPFGGVPPGLPTVHVVAGFRSDGPACLVKARAVLFVAGALGGPWRATTVLGWLPTGLLDWGYDLVARYRHRLLGRRDTCFIPRPEHRARFLDLPEGADRS